MVNEIMCGVYGYISPNKQSRFLQIAEKVNSFRGPDKSSLFSLIANFKNIEFGHSRLTITGNERNGHQPVVNNNCVMTYNGEIFNFDGPLVGNKSDTEFVFDALKDQFDHPTLNNFNGFFAIGLYYFDTGTCYLIRDRYGEKPLYYHYDGESIFFSSAAKALAFAESLVLKDIAEKIGGGILFDEMAPATGINQVLPGHYIKFSNGKIETHKWYRPNDQFKHIKNFNHAVDIYDTLLRDAVSLRIKDQKRVAVSLSGGIDSTLIADTVISLGNVEIDAFTFKVKDARYNETRVAKNHAKQLNTKLNVVIEKQYNKKMYNECLDALEFGSYNLSFVGYSNYYKAVSDKGIRVILEGHGPDEYLGGYPPMFIAYMARLFLKCNFKKFQESKSLYSDFFGDKFKFKSVLGQFLNAILGFSMPSGRRTNDEFFSKLSLPIVLRTFDRISMLRNVEIRSPFMDYRLVEFGKSLPDEYIFYDNQPKAILRQILKNRGYKIDSFGKKIGFTASYGSLLKELGMEEGLEEVLVGSREHYHKASFAINKKISQKIFDGVYDEKSKSLF